MKILDPGHSYLIEALEGGDDQVLTFVKRVGENYPGNTDGHGGPITQEVLRALIDRVKHMQGQGSCVETSVIINSLQTALLMFEVRAARCRETQILLPRLDEIELEKTCPICGHIQCDQSRHSRPHWSDKKPITIQA